MTVKRARRFIISYRFKNCSPSKKSGIVSLWRFKVRYLLLHKQRAIMIYNDWHIKIYQYSTGFILNARRMDPTIHFLLFQILYVTPRVARTRSPLYSMFVQYPNPRPSAINKMDGPTSVLSHTHDSTISICTTVWRAIKKWLYSILLEFSITIQISIF